MNLYHSLSIFRILTYTTMINPKYTVEKLNQLGANNMGSHIGMKFTEVGVDFLCAKMPVDHRTTQPFGLLHGGASCVLAETLGSVGSLCFVDEEKYNVVGVEINANHLRSAKNGYVYGRATLLHGGKKLHVWDIRITNEEGKLICISRLTVAILPKGA